MRWCVVLVVAACKFEHGGLMVGDAAPPDDAIDAVDAPPDAPIDSTTSACAIEVAAASAHTCARKMDGTVWCWGKNGSGETSKDPSNSATCNVGGNDFVCVKNPKLVPLTGAATAMGAGDQHTCVLVGAKTYCFGANDGGQFGNGNSGDSFDPVEITARASSTQIAGSDASTCSLIGGNVMCSGTNNHGEVGDNTTTVSYTPYLAQVGAQKVAMGFQDTCSVSNAFVFCWGDNTTGQIDTTGQVRHTPTAVPNAPQSVDVTVGIGHVCARKADGTVWCWGKNTDGQIGKGTTGTPEPPALVSLTNVAQIVAGVNHTCARLVNGDVKCWGESFTSSPATIALPMPAISIAAGSYHTCAALVDGTVWCWGWNAYGQYGNGSSSTQINNTPAKSDVCP